MEPEALIGGEVQPGGRTPAPGGLALVQAFVNTVDLEHGPDLFAERAGLGAWLERWLPEAGTSPAPGELATALELREALRALLLANNGGPDAPIARTVLEQAADRAGLRARFGPGTPFLAPARDGVDGALGRVAAAAFAAMLDGSWARLKACPRDCCHWAFFDRSSNASATWCSMSVCGSRVKSGAYYRRRRAAAP